ncbi:TPA: hypothetical protein ACNP34_005131, partial [Citrobacter freundii]|uniref:hypothetical protein n=1 Tax=Citrobacter freundii TaxID=546 RepID=UPI0023B0F476
IRVMWTAPKGIECLITLQRIAFYLQLVAIKFASLESWFLCKVFNVLVNHFYMALSHLYS